jgi:hypothetical protein
MTSTIETDSKNRKRTLLKFLLGTPTEQPILFRQIINHELLKHKDYINNNSDLNSNYKEYNEQLREMIYNSKLKEVERHTKILREQMTAQAKNEKYPSIISIIERKLYIVELQIDIGIYNIIQNKNVKFYFEV